ncbi:hypothetical protein [Burkholderia perseverans]|uniref:hypothetical protein n=1 Tax=Burkholderia perseverans TaxID=2615214 RepID=UPI001FEF1C04|nr:hypothetical protein [Burkholderia perseverans]
MTRHLPSRASGRARAARRRLAAGLGLAVGALAVSAGSACAFAAPVSASAPAAAIRFHAAVAVDNAGVTLAELADLTPLPPAIREHAASLVMVSLAPTAKAVHVDARRLADAARHAMPRLAPWLAGTTAREIEIVRRPPAATAARASGICVTLLVDLPAAASPSADQLGQAPCPAAGVRSAWRYDAAQRVARATRALPAGEVVRPPAGPLLAVVHGGERVSDTVRVGAVTVTRSGTALTDAGARRDAAVLTGDAAVQLWRAPTEDRGS